ncbi:MAG: hypothetical protein WD638_09950 [Nitriliruptoraceae bacterium]
MDLDAVELIGYLASALIVLSLLMASLFKLRVVNLIGAIVFTAYGLLIDSLPVVLTNASIVAIDVFYLTRMFRARADEAYFEVVGVPAASPLLRRFVAFHTEDARRFQPDFTGLGDDHLAWMVLRDAVPVGVVLARADGEVAHLDLDYVTPAHRDQRAGTRFFTTPGLFSPHGISRVRSTAGANGHHRYLEAMGFTPIGDGSYERTVA